MRGKQIVAAVLSLVLASVVVWAIPESPLRRMSNLDFEASGLPQTYLAPSRSRPDRCRLLDRRESTMRRADVREAGPRARCERFRAGDGVAMGGSEAWPMDGWVVVPRSPGRGTILFVPIYAVDDITYPYFNEFVRAREPSLDLPRMRFTLLFVDRLYTGLFLQIDLPYDRPSSEGGSGVLRSILSVAPDRTVVLNTRLGQGDDAFAIRSAQRTAEAGEREAANDVSVPSPSLAWLAGLRAANERSYLMSNRPPYAIVPLPIPVSLRAIVEAKDGHALSPVAGWHVSLGTGSPPSAPDTPPFDPDEVNRLREGFAAYVRALSLAMRLEGAFHESGETLRAEIPQRTRAAFRAGLGTMES